MATELIGYCDKFSVAPGEKLAFKVSTDLARYEVAVVRLIHGDENPAGPGYKEEVVPTPIDGAYPGRRQEIHCGSWLTVPDRPALRGLNSLTLQAWIFPTGTGRGERQGLISKRKRLHLRLPIAAHHQPAPQVSQVAAGRPPTPGQRPLPGGLAGSQGIRLRRHHQQVIEDIPQLKSERLYGGSTHPPIRADMVYFETALGGAVFSVGSMSWCGSLSHNDYDNNVSRITENVLREFLQ